jgi:hypothetical protein
MKKLVKYLLIPCLLIGLNFSIYGQCFYILKGGATACLQNANFTISEQANLHLVNDPHISAITWTWDFGDGNTISGTRADLISRGYTMGHTYNAPGIYAATLTLRLTRNDQGICDVVFNGQDIVYEPTSPTSIAVAKLRFTVNILDQNSIRITGATPVCSGSTGQYSVTPIPGATYTWQLRPAGGTLITYPNSSVPNFTIPNNLPIGVNNLIVIIFFPQGCLLTKIIQIQVNPCCQLNASISGNTKVCQGISTALTAFVNPPSTACSTAFTYRWSTGETTQTINVTPTANTAYSVTVTCATSGCSGSATTNVFMMPAPAISLVSESIRCNGTTSAVSLDINVTGGTPTYSYLWNNGITTQDLTNVTGTATAYCVSVKDANGCKAVKCFDCLTPCTTNTNLAPAPIVAFTTANTAIVPSIEKEESVEKVTSKIEVINSQKTPKVSLKAFPNPFTTEITLEWSKQTEDMSTTIINLYNATGQLITTQTLEEAIQTTKLNLALLPNGLYHIALIRKGEVISNTKVMKN